MLSGIKAAAVTRSTEGGVKTRLQPITQNTRKNCSAFFLMYSNRKSRNDKEIKKKKKEELLPRYVYRRGDRVLSFSVGAGQGAG
jgi:hypothetical protein